jgi:hypothetical protein
MFFYNKNTHMSHYRKSSEQQKFQVLQQKSLTPPTKNYTIQKSLQCVKKECYKKCLNNIFIRALICNKNGK